MLGPRPVTTRSAVDLHHEAALWAHLRAVLEHVTGPTPAPWR
ncbi:hypothetical protein ACQPZQ_15530 [Pseudonocardia sp. CA-142604]